MTVSVNAMDSQRWACRIQWCQFKTNSFDDVPRRAARRTSVGPRQKLLQLCEELLPTRIGAAVGLPLIRPEAHLLHAQMSPRARRSERKGHHALQIVGCVVVREVPGVGQRF